MKKILFMLVCVCVLSLCSCMTFVEGGLAFSDKKNVVRSAMEKRAYFEDENALWVVDSYKDKHGYDTFDNYVTNSSHFRGLKSGMLSNRHVSYADFIILEDCLAVILYGTDGSREYVNKDDSFVIRVVGSSSSVVSFEDYIFNDNGSIMITASSADGLLRALADNQVLGLNILRRNSAGFEENYNFEVQTTGLAPAYIRAFP